MTKPATTTADPEFNIPDSGEPNKPKQPDPPQAQAAQQPGGGGAPNTGGVQEEPTPEEVKKIARSEAQLDEPESSGDDG